MTLFGPSGNSVAFAEAGNKTTEQSAVWVKQMGLNAFEYSFGRGILMSEERAVSIAQAFKNNNIAISVHAPYYINFANHDSEMIEKSIDYVLKSAQMVKLMGGNRLYFTLQRKAKILVATLLKELNKIFISLLKLFTKTIYKT